MAIAIAGYLGHLLAFINAPLIIVALVLALILPLIWKDNARHLIGVAALGVASLFEGFRQVSRAALVHGWQVGHLDKQASLEFGYVEAWKVGMPIPLLVTAACLYLSWHLRSSRLAWFISPALLLVLGFYYSQLIADYWTEINAVPIRQS